MKLFVLRVKYTNLLNKAFEELAALSLATDSEEFEFERPQAEHEATDGKAFTRG
jgi:hypothetical protein